jgi:hypothetical protein
MELASCHRLVLRIMRCVLDFWKIIAPLSYEAGQPRRRSAGVVKNFPVSLRESNRCCQARSQL